MPDLTTEYFYYCKSVENFVSIQGDYLVRHGVSVFGDYQYDWHCQCQGFKFRKKCKHIEAAKKEYCGWDQFIHGDGPNVMIEDDGKTLLCPKCGGHVSSRGVAV